LVGFQIAGFILILAAIKPMPQREGNFVTGLDYLGNVMSTQHPNINRIGIILVIIGLGFQLSNSFID